MSVRGDWESWERNEESQDHFDAYREYYHRQAARLKELGILLENWRSRTGEAAEEETTGQYDEVGRLEERLEETRHDLDELDETGNWEELRDDVDRTISDLEDAIAEAAPRYQ
jgi:chromosome segregation ATPase